MQGEMKVLPYTIHVRKAKLPNMERNKEQRLNKRGGHKEENKRTQKEKEIKKKIKAIA